jgi:hypothetical protein
VAHGAITEDKEGYVEGLSHSTRLKGGDVCKVSYVCRLTTVRLSGRVRNVSKEVKCYSATTFFLCETHYRKATAGYGGVAVWWSNMVPRSSPTGGACVKEVADVNERQY